MFNTILQCGHEMTDILSEMTRRDRAVEIKEILARYTTDVIGSCAFGLECNSMRNPDAEFRIMGRRAFTQTVGDVLKMVRDLLHSKTSLNEVKFDPIIFRLL